MKACKNLYLTLLVIQSSGYLFLILEPSNVFFHVSCLVIDDLESPFSEGSCNLSESYEILLSSLELFKEY